jgi:hypothetical protein
MPNWWIIVRDIVWASVFAVLAVILTILVAIFAPTNLGLIIGAGLSAISLSILALRQ